MPELLRNRSEWVTRRNANGYTQVLIGTYKEGGEQWLTLLSDVGAESHVDEAMEVLLAAGGNIADPPAVEGEEDEVEEETDVMEPSTEAVEVPGTEGAPADDDTPVPPPNEASNEGAPPQVDPPPDGSST